MADFYERMFTSGAYKTFPMPTDFYKKYNLPLPEPMSITEFLPIASRAFATTETGELRPVAPGGLRPIPERKIETIETIADSSDELSG